MICREIIKEMDTHKKLIIFLLTPILFSPMLFFGNQIGAASFILALSVVYYVTEAIPLAITALLPVLLGPILGVLESSRICSSYFRDATVISIVGVVMAIALERWNVHKRLALLVLRFAGSEPKWLIFGFMWPTWFISMWISNIACASLMIPIAEAVLKEISIVQKSSDYGSLPQNEVNHEQTVILISEGIEESKPNKMDSNFRTDDDEDEEGGKCCKKRIGGALDSHCTNLEKALMLAILYSTSLGGVCTLTGAGSILVAMEITIRQFGMQTGVNYLTWMCYAVPVSVCLMIVTWMYLQFWFCGIRSFTTCFEADAYQREKVKSYMYKAYQSLGKITFPEISIITFLCILIVLWITRKPGFEGWSILFKPEYVRETQPAVLILIIMCIWPSRNIFRKQQLGTDGKLEKDDFILTWSMINKGYPWNNLLMMGGGDALAVISQESGLSRVLSKQLLVLEHLPTSVLVFIMSFMTSAITEILTNKATVSIVLPVLWELAICLHINPLMLTLSSTLSACFSLCLPMGSNTNVFILSRGYVNICDMVKVGILIKILIVFAITGATMTYGAAIFNLHEYPHWAGPCLSPIHHNASLSSQPNITTTIISSV